MKIYRTRFVQDIIAEFVPPTNRKSRKVLILCHGLPSIPKKNKVLEFYAEQGYWVFFPRYRGSWESDGQFLAKSPHLDVLDVIDQLPNGFTEFWTGEEINIQPTKIHLLGSSFGGAAVLLASQDERVNKVFAFSPVVDWTQDSKVEPLDWLREFTKNAFGNAYRFSDPDWNKLKNGEFYNPLYAADKIDGSKVMIVHAQDDDLVPYKSVKEFSDQVGAKLWTLKEGGHLSSSRAIDPAYFEKIEAFFS